MEKVQSHSMESNSSILKGKAEQQWKSDFKDIVDQMQQLEKQCQE